MKGRTFVTAAVLTPLVDGEVAACSAVQSPMILDMPRSLGMNLEA